METVLGVVAFAVLVLGIGSRQWRHDVREKIAEVREDRRLRKKYDI